MVRLTGTPLRLDDGLRPLARLILVVGGLAGTALLTWLGWWYTAPLPIAGALLAYELLFWWRGDRPVQLVLDERGRRIVCVDPVADRTLSIPLDEVHAATLHVSAGASDDRMEAVLVLSTTSSTCFAARFLVEPSLDLRRHDVRVDAVSEMLGGRAGMRALAPAEVSCRQVIDDPAAQAVRWLRAHLPAAAWDRTAVRVWHGAAPPLDLFGLHEGPPDALLVLDGDRWTLRGRDTHATGAITLVRGARAERPITLLRPGSSHADAAVADEHDLRLLVLELDTDLTVALPAPEAGAHGEQVFADPSWWHTHLWEGSSIVWHLIVRWPVSTWPTALRRHASIVEAHVPHSDAASSPSRHPSTFRNP